MDENTAKNIDRQDKEAEDELTALVRAAAGGDPSACYQLLASPAVRAIVERICKTTVRRFTTSEYYFGAEDLAQEIFLRLLKHPERLNSIHGLNENSFSAYIATVARNFVVDKARKSRAMGKPRKGKSKAPRRKKSLWSALKRESALDPGELRTLAIGELESLSSFLDSDPESIDSMSADDVIGELRELGHDPDKPLFGSANRIIECGKEQTLHSFRQRNTAEEVRKTAKLKNVSEPLMQSVEAMEESNSLRRFGGPAPNTRTTSDAIYEAPSYFQSHYAGGAQALPDLVCLSHLRWDFVYQRPQHLLSRFAKQRRVFFVEEPVLADESMRMDISRRDDGVYVVVPHLPQEMLGQDTDGVLSDMINQFYEEQAITEHVLWYYTPMALGWSRHLQPLATVYDCMDELSAFKGAPQALRERELELFKRADLVFTGGQSLYEVKRDQHPQVYAFPSSIDAPHFAQARSIKSDPEDQAHIPHPRLGFFGVIDERMDIELLDALAEARPDWHLVIIGPVVKIDEAQLPRRANIHYLGGKSYQELPAYLSGWDVALLPFALNESTRFISPTKTPEYLAAGKPVVSTSIRDVVRPYSELGMVQIADTAAEFVAACEAAMEEDAAARLREVDAFLAQTSWDRTWRRMSGLIEDVIGLRLAAGASETLRRPVEVEVIYSVKKVSF